MEFIRLSIQTPDLSEPQIELMTVELSDIGEAHGIELGFEFGGDLFDSYIPIPAPGLEPDPVPAAPASVTVHLPANEQGRAAAAAIGLFAEGRGLAHDTLTVAEQDWENNWKAYFKPFEIGKRLVIKPSWEEYENTQGRLLLEIDPASAFGTGQHATTRMCLELLEERIKGGERILDIGSGSGILSAAAGLLGAKHICAMDICENAVRITRETLALNNITACDVLCANPVRDGITGEFDITVANLTADVIITMAEVLANLKTRTVILSGIIAPRLPEVIAALEPHFTISETRESEDWIALTVDGS